jgi:type I restriction enzyme M protein
LGDFDTPIDEAMQNNVSRHNLVDMMTFDRVEFEKNISLSVKKKVKFENIWGTNGLKFLGEIAKIKKGTSITKEKTAKGTIPVVAGGQEPAYFHNESNREGNVITISASGAYAGFVNYFETPIFASDCNTIISNDENQISTKLIYLFLKSIQNEIYGLQRGQAQPHVYGEDLSTVKIPLPPLDIQQKIVAEIEVLEAKEKRAKEDVKKLKLEASNLFVFDGERVSLQSITTKIGSGATPRGGEAAYVESGIALIRSMNVYDNEFYPKGLAFVDDEQARKLNNVTVEENDILFNITGASVCRCCIVENKYLPARVNQHVSIIRINEKALPKFVQQLLISSKFKAELLELADNSSTREAITKQQLEDFRIPLPSFAEQQKIVSKI